MRPARRVAELDRPRLLESAERGDLHVAHDGRGVPSNHAAPEELVALDITSVDFDGARGASALTAGFAGFADSASIFACGTSRMLAKGNMNSVLASG